MSEVRTPLLHVEGLKQHFRINRRQTTKAVDGISFDIYEGETYGLVGESGSGKSTTGRAIIRLYDPTDGKIIFDGHDISGKLKKEDASYLRTNMAMIFQDPMACLNPRKKVKQIIAEGLEIHHLCKNQAEIDEKVNNILDKVGLSREQATRFPHQFSGGQRQRVGIARAMIMEPKFIIADEPISALDVSIRAQVLNLMNKFKEERGLTYMFIAHDLSVVRYFADRIAVIHNGRIVEVAPTEELFKYPLHPYTLSLLQAVPMPDPQIEKAKELVVYDESKRDLSGEKPILREIRPAHFVFANERELGEYQQKLKEMHAE